MPARHRLAWGIGGLLAIVALAALAAALSGGAEAPVSVPPGTRLVVVGDGPGFGERMAAWLQALGVFSVVIAGGALALQLTQANRTMKAQMFDQTAQRMAHLDDMVLQSPRARTALYGDTPGLDAETMTVTEALIDYFDTELLRRDQFPDLVWELPDFRPWIIDMLRRPAADAVLAGAGDWYSDELAALHRRSKLPAALDAGRERLVYRGPSATPDGPRAVPATAAPGDLLLSGDRRPWSVDLVVGRMHHDGARLTARCAPLGRADVEFPANGLVTDGEWVLVGDDTERARVLAELLATPEIARSVEGARGVRRAIALRVLT